MASQSLSRYCVRAATAPSTSLARTFIQLTPRRALSTAPLDFLAPRGLPRDIRAASGSISRTFTTSSRARATAIFNPRADDDGNDMTIEITPSASKRLKAIMTKDLNPNLALRVRVESGGCHGFQYLLSTINLPAHLSQETSPSTLEQKPADVETKPTTLGMPDEEDAKFDAEEDTIFEADDGSGAKVVMDAPSLELLKGSKIDYTVQLIGAQFQVVNPHATSSCGCGTSFDLKF